MEEPYGLSKAYRCSPRTCPNSLTKGYHHSGRAWLGFLSCTLLTTLIPLQAKDVGKADIMRKFLCGSSMQNQNWISRRQIVLKTSNNKNFQETNEMPWLVLLVMRRAMERLMPTWSRSQSFSEGFYQMISQVPLNHGIL